jgi:hypothetical protein
MRLVEVWLPPAFICALGLLAEVGATRDEPARIVTLESAAMFILLASWTLWLARTGANSPQVPSVSLKGG